MFFNLKMVFKNGFRNKGQVWVETAIYTLIGLTVIAILLAAITPQIEKAKDKGIVSQTITAINTLDSKISETEQAAGNIRIVSIRIGKGKLEVNSENDSIRYILEDTRFEMSQVGNDIKEGNLILRTDKKGSRFNIIITRKYDGINITYEGAEKSKNLPAAGTPYKIQIENVGDELVNQKTHIDFEII